MTNSAIETLTIYVPAVKTQEIRYNEIYAENCDRIYSLAFWMTDNELTAEELSTNTFLRAFAATDQPAGEQIDRAFLTEVREFTAIGVLTLNSATSTQTQSMHHNVKRIHLERAVVQLPATEKLIFLMHDVEGYEHGRISRLLGITLEESKAGLHQARMQIRNLIARM
ncbi:MAG TPA: RNA polymerase sigma factor [Candidatus Angelobacter sp.]|nr:RNA polymerase sigma factor [Candidatus Angelobacter sp.]